MMHLFKLKKDGKTVGYLKIEKGDVFYQTPEIDWWNKWRCEPRQILFDTAHPFVTKDKNGKDVFAGDKAAATLRRHAKIHRHRIEGIVSISEESGAYRIGYHRIEDLGDIELIEEQE